MNAGVLRGKVKSGSIDKVVKTYKDIVLKGYARIEGARGGQMWVNRTTGETLTIGFYDGQEAARAFQPVADQALAAMKDDLTVESDGREFYELAASTLEESVEVVKAGMAAFNAHDSEAIARLTAPDAEGWAAGLGTYKGVQATKDFNEGWFRAFPDCTVTIDRIYGQGRYVILEGTFTGTHTGPLATTMGELPATGKQSTGPFVEIFEIDRGLVKTSRLYYDRMLLAEQLGVLASGTGAESTA